MTSARLRPMTTADLPAVLELEYALFGDEAWSRQMLEAELAQQPASRHYLVAVDDSAPGTCAGDDRGPAPRSADHRAADHRAAGGRPIAGYGGLMAAGSQADVLTLAVAKEHWGRGVGSALLEALLAEAARRGCTEVFLEVRVDNTRAQALYLRYDFTQVGIRKGYYQPSGADALVMRRGMSRLPSGAAASRATQAGPGRPPGADLCLGSGDRPAGRRHNSQATGRHRGRARGGPGGRVGGEQ